MARKQVLVLGGNFGGLTAALAVQHALDGDIDVRVVSASDRFLFNPPQALRAHPRPPEPPHEARLREVLPLEVPQRLRQPPLKIHTGEAA
jgi:NADH dehydrogenase FAD-containing subunit